MDTLPASFESPQKERFKLVATTGHLGLRHAIQIAEANDPLLFGHALLRDISLGWSIKEVAVHRSVSPKDIQNELGKVKELYGAQTLGQATYLALEAERLDARRNTRGGRPHVLRKNSMRSFVSCIQQGAKNTADLASQLEIDEREVEVRYHDLLFCTNAKNIPQAMRYVFQGGYRFEQGAPTMRFSMTGLERLVEFSPKRKQLIEDRSRGLTNVQSAALRGVSKETQKTHARFILNLLAARDMAHAITKATTLKSIETPRIAEPPPQLSLRRLQMLFLLALGLENKEIGAKLGVGGQTVKTILSHCCSQLGAKNREHAVRRAFETGVFVVDHSVTLSSTG